MKRKQSRRVVKMLDVQHIVLSVSHNAYGHQTDHLSLQHQKNTIIIYYKHIFAKIFDGTLEGHHEPNRTGPLRRQPLPANSPY